MNDLPPSIPPAHHGKPQAVSSELIWILLGLSTLVLLFLTSRSDPILFHGMAEILCIALAWAVFMLVWNARRFLDNTALLFLGSAYLFIGLVDLLHVMAFREIAFSTDWGVNTCSQLWIIGRFLEALALMLFAFALCHRIQPVSGLIFWAGLSAVLVGTVFFWRVFPDCFQEGSGLTAFHIWSEYLICLLLLAALIMLHHRRRLLEVRVYGLLAFSIFLTLCAQIVFIVHQDVYESSNVAGHFLKIISFMFLYLALIRAALTNPFDRLRHELEQEKADLQEARTRLDLIFDTVPALIWQKDTRGVYQRANQTFCQTLAIPREEILGKTDMQLFPPKIAEKFHDDDQEILRTGQGLSGMEEQYVSAKGELGWLITDKMVFQDREGRVTGTIGFAQDITHRKQAQRREREHQEQLDQAAKMAALGTLVAGVAHEVNNPNNFIMLNAPLLQQVWNDSLPILEQYHQDHPDFELARVPFAQMRDYTHELFSGIQEGSQRIKHIVAELKHFARQSPLDMSQEVDLNQVVEAALTMLRKTIAQHTDHFQTILAPEPPRVRGDFQKLEQVVVNLLINACQALPDKQHTIVLETYAWEQDVVLRITDNGSGIPAHLLSRIRDPFFSTKQSIGGIGLGLAISTAVIQDHGGHMVFDSAPNLGTTVTVSLRALP